MRQIRTVLVDSRVLDELIEAAQEALPRESCGFLVGHGETAERFIPVPNTATGDNEYFMDPQRLIDTFRQTRLSGEQLVAICHSHPRGPAEPSDRDLAEACYPELAHVIVSLADRDRPSVRAFRIIDGKGYEIELRTMA